MNHAGPDIAPERALDFLNKALPLADRMTMGGEAAERVARHALALRRETPWGMSIPEDVFLAYVLFPRVNNENPEFYHEIIWNQLKPRLAGLDMAAAVAEVNRWCFEQATYRSTDGRTANALTVMRRGYGRCGEESVLLVSALRSCGIPARQLYVPLWSHCDDNHAWVEAWVDGEWRYMGACEPELSLDSGWFTAAASKAMLVHTRAWGVLPAGERAEAHDGTAWVVNRTAAYARTALLRVRLVEGGRPLPGVFVRVELANMAAFGRISDKTTDHNDASTSFGLRVVPGMNYAFNSHFSMDLYINLLSAYWDMTTYDGGAEHAWGLGANMNAQTVNAHLSNFSIGFNYAF